MAFLRTLAKILFLSTEHADNTDLRFASTVKKTEKLRPIREIRVQKTANLVLDKAVESSS